MYFRAVENLTPSFIEHAIAPHVGKTSKFISMLVKNLFAKHNIPLSKEQFIVLICVEQGAKPQSSLVNITERNKGSLTRLVQSLEKKRYVKRKDCCEDNRVNWVEITEEGRTILKKTKPLMQEVFSLLQTGIEEEEKRTALKVIQRMQQNAIEEIEKLDRISTIE